MAEFLRQLRRAATQLATRQVIVATAAFPAGLQRSIVRSSVTLVGSIFVLCTVIALVLLI